MSRMQTRSRTSIKNKKEELSTPLRHRMVTRSQTKEEARRILPKQKSKPEMKPTCEKDSWFINYILKSLKLINDINKIPYSNEVKIIESVRIVDELYFMINNYLIEFIEKDLQKWRPFTVVALDKVDTLVKEMEWGLMSIKNPEKITYLHQVMKQIKETKKKYEGYLKPLE